MTAFPQFTHRPALKQMRGLVRKKHNEMKITITRTQPVTEEIEITFPFYFKRELPSKRVYKAVDERETVAIWCGVGMYEITTVITEGALQTAPFEEITKEKFEAEACPVIEYLTKKIVL